jgi:hypothetical protein
MIEQQDKPTTRQAIAARDRSAPMQVTGRLRAALHEMVWQGSRRDDAAKNNGLTVHGLREALKKAHVKAFYLAELRALRESERAKTFHRLCELRDQDDNKNAAVAASKVLENIADEQARAPAQGQQLPGLQIVIVTPAAPRAPGLTIEHTPAGDDETRGPR